MKRIIPITLPILFSFILSSCGSTQLFNITLTPAPSLTASAVTPAPSATSLVVTSTRDIVNGDTTSLDKLLADSGADGISLREALMVTDEEARAITISFSPGLAGSTIKLTDGLPIRGSHIIIAGFDDESGRPALTLDMNETHPGPYSRGGFLVMGSDIVIRNLHLIGLGGGSGHIGVALLPESDGTVSNIRIEGNIFEGTGPNGSEGISFKNSDNVYPTTIRDVVITGNTFMDIQNDKDAIHIGSRGNKSLRENILITDNTFLRTTFPIELENGGTGNLIKNVQIIDNHFTDNHQPISLGTIGDFGREFSGNIISDTLVSGNVFENNDSSMGIVGGYQNGSNGSVKGNMVLNTQFIHNVIRSNTGGIYMAGGQSNGASGNSIADTLISRNVFEDNAQNALTINGGIQESTDNTIKNTNIVNNVMTGNQSGAIYLCGGESNASANQLAGINITNNTVVNNNNRSGRAIEICAGDLGNVVSGVKISNSIFWGYAADFFGVNPEQVFYSITTQAGFPGVNGNKSKNPLLSDPASGDYHLKAGSPAIDSATSEDAPASDFDCSERFDDPSTPNTGAGTTPFYDIGAFEFNNASTPCPPTNP